LTRPSLAGKLRRDLGRAESYAALLGILIGAGIFRVTADVGRITGPSAILGYLVLAPAILATSVAYCVFLSTPLGSEPGGEYAHISRTLCGHRLAFVGAWLKITSYIGAMAYLSHALADYIIEIAAGWLGAEARLGLALACLAIFYVIHAVGVRWFGRIQVAMCLLLALSLVVLVVPGLTAVSLSNYRPFFTQGGWGFLAAMIPLFFSYAGFESLAQAAGEVKDSRRHLPRVFLLGLCASTIIFATMSAVAFGVLPQERIAGSPAPMADVAAVYLPAGATAFVNLGAIMAIATSLNSTMLVPSRLGIMLAADGLAPGWLGTVSARTGTPLVGLTLTAGMGALLLASDQIGLALNIAVFALLVLYLLHSAMVLMLPRWNPDLYRQVTVRIPRWIQVASALVSIASMGGLALLQVSEDLNVLVQSSIAERISGLSLTSLEITIAWGLVGLGAYALGRRARRS